jgi:hypothetical protein
MYRRHEVSTSVWESVSFTVLNGLCLSLCLSQWLMSLSLSLSLAYASLSVSLTGLCLSLCLSQWRESLSLSLSMAYVSLSVSLTDFTIQLTQLLTDHFIDASKCVTHVGSPLFKRLAPPCM